MNSSGLHRDCVPHLHFHLRVEDVVGRFAGTLIEMSKKRYVSTGAVCGITGNNTFLGSVAKGDPSSVWQGEADGREPTGVVPCTSFPGRDHRPLHTLLPASAQLPRSSGLSRSSCNHLAIP